MQCCEMAGGMLWQRTMSTQTLGLHWGGKEAQLGLLWAGRADPIALGHLPAPPSFLTPPPAPVSVTHRASCLASHGGVPLARSPCGQVGASWVGREGRPGRRFGIRGDVLKQIGPLGRGLRVR